MSVRAILFCALSVLLAQSAGAQRNFVVSLMGQEAGAISLTRGLDGAYEVHFKYDDRGRGPDIRSHILVDESGIPVEIRNTGLDYLKSPIHETFTLRDGVAQWESRVEHGSAEPDAPVFFYAASASPLDRGFLAQALLKADGNTLDLLPAGRATLQHVGTLTYGEGDGAATIHQYEISGLDFEPQPVWLTERGDFFAVADPWVSVLPTEESGLRDALLEAQRENATKRELKLARELGTPLTRPLAFIHADVFDSESRIIRHDQTVVVNGDRIAAVGDDASAHVPDGAAEIDATGKTMIPGLWDMHTHLQAIDGPLNIAAGVTTVRDLANDPDVLADLMKRWDAGQAIGPRVIAAGIIDGAGPYAGPTEALVSNEDEAVAWVDRYADLGYQQIKIYSSVDTSLVAPIILEAKQRGMRVSGHIPANMWAEDAVRAGYDEIQHINMFFLNFYKDVTDTRTPARFSAVAERGADLDLESDEVVAFVDLLQNNDIVWDPTIMIFEHLLLAKPGEDSPAFAAVIDRFPPQVQRHLRKGGLPTGDDERTRAAFERMLDVIAYLHEAGIVIVAGTDNMAGFALQRELELYVHAGIPAAEVLYIATLGAARVMGRDDEMGVIRPGMLADVALVDGDPLSSISDLRNVELVVKGGILYESSRIYAAIGVQ